MIAYEIFENSPTPNFSPSFLSSKLHRSAFQLEKNNLHSLIFRNDLHVSGKCQKQSNEVKILQVALEKMKIPQFSSKIIQDCTVIGVLESFPLKLASNQDSSFRAG